MKQFTKDELDALVASGEKVVVDFFASWCGPCKMLAPVFESAAAKAEGRAVFGKVDIDAEPELQQRYGIMTVPTIILFKDGAVAHRQSGLMNEAMLLELLEK